MPRALLGGLLSAGLAAGLVVMHSRSLPFPFTWVPTEAVDAGEMLLHGVKTSGLVSFTMPSASVSHAAFFSHGSLGSQKLAWSLTQAAFYGLTFALGLLLAGWPCAVGALIFIPAFPNPLLDLLHASYTVLLLIVAGLLVRRSRAPTPANSVLLGLAIGVSVLYRSPLLFFPVGLAAFDWLSSPRGARPGWKILLPPLLIPLVFLLPWARMNWILHGEFIPLEWHRVDPGLVTAVLGFVQKTDLDLSVLLNGAGSPRAGGLLAWAAGQIFSHPFAYLESCLRRALYILSFHPVLFSAAFASLCLYRRRAEWRVLGLLAVYFSAVHCALTIAPAYVVPLGPLLAVLAASLPAAACEAYAPWATGPRSRAAASRVFVACLALASSFTLFTLAVVTGYGRMAQRRPLDSPKAWTEAVASAKPCFWLFFHEGRRRLNLGDIPGAREYFSKAAALRPGDKTGEFYLAWTLSLGGHPAPLLGLRLDPELEPDASFKQTFVLAELALRSGNKERARGLIAGGLRRFVAPSSSVQWPAKPRPDSERLRTRPLSLLESLKEVLDRMSVRQRASLLGAIAQEGDPVSIVDVWLSLALSAAEKRDDRRALAALAAVRGIELRPAEIRSVLKTYVRLGKFDIAEEFAGSLGGASSEARLDLAAIALDAGRQDLAIKTLGKTGELVPERVLQLVILLNRMEKNKRVLALIKEFSARHSGYADLWRGLVAEERAKPAAIVPSPNDRCTRQLTLLLPIKGSAPRVRDMFDACARREAGDAGGWLDLASAALDAGQRDLALRSLKIAAKAPLEQDRVRQLALLIGRTGDDRRALKLLRESTEKHPGDFKSWLARADIEKKTDRDQALVSAARSESLARGPADAREVALTYQGLRAYSKACAMLAELAGRSSRDATLLLDKGVCEYLRGSAPDAERDFKLALELDPALSGAALSLGVVYRKQRRDAEALQVYDRALARVSAGDPVRRLLIEARRELLSARKKP